MKVSIMKIGLKDNLSSMS